MTFFQLQERLRVELLSRIERGGITVSLLALRSGLQQPHLSNFLRNRRRLSLAALDRVLLTLGLSAADLVPVPANTRVFSAEGVPLVSVEVAMNDDLIRAVSILGRIPFTVVGKLPPEIAEQNVRRPRRERFVALTLQAVHVAHMEPRLYPGATVILDRLAAFPVASPATPSIYAVRFAGTVRFCYLSYDQGFLVLRPHALEAPIAMLAIPPSATPAALVAGRVCWIGQPL